MKLLESCLIHAHILVYFPGFVRQRAGAEGRSSSMESEDETEVPPLLRTISMETDDVSTGGADVGGGSVPFFAGSSSSLESAAVSTPAPARKVQAQVGNSILLYKFCPHVLFIYFNLLFSFH